MRRSLLAVLVFATAVAPAVAADVPLSGDRARLADYGTQRSAELTSDSAAIDVTSVDPTVSGATLDIVSVVTGQQLTLSLPASGWRATGPGRVRFDGTGDPKIKVRVVQGKRLRIVVKGAGGLALGQPQGSIAASLTIGATRFCLVFGGTITKDTDKRFAARDAAAPATCPDPCVGKPDETACDDGKVCTAASKCRGGVCASESPTCRDDTKQNDESFCNLATGSCTSSITPCPPFDDNNDNDVNLCRPLKRVDAATGYCIYDGTLCHPLGCNPELCNPDTGMCEEVPAEQCDVPCSTPTFPEEPCFMGTCSTEYCFPNVDEIPNCDAVTVVNCPADADDSCYTVPPDDSVTGHFQGCKEGVGCDYGVKTCPAPSDPCTELELDGNASECCQYVPKDCAGRFGNAPGYTYSCVNEGGVGVCRATPQ